MDLTRQLGFGTVVLVVIADMIGTGIFMTTGNVLGMTQNAMYVLVLWIVGAVVAIAGSLCYSELAVMWPDVGGEYIYLKNMYGSLLPSFLTGWISLMVAFTAPVAIAALTVMGYLQKVFVPGSPLYFFFGDPWTQRYCAAGIIIVFGVIHGAGVQQGSRIQNVLTVMKILIVITLIVSGAVYADWTRAGRLVADYTPAGSGTGGSVSALGLSLLMVMFAYSGWNSASYISGEIRNPAKTLPRAMFFGTLATAVLYLGLNVIFLISAPGEALMGRNEIGAIAVISLFGEHISWIFNCGIVIILLSAISVQIMVGPRIYFAMARDRVIFRFLERVHPRYHTPLVSITIQVFISVAYVFTFDNPEVLLVYMGFALGIFPLLTVFGLVMLRRTRPEIPRPYRVSFYPVPPLLFLALYSAMMIASFIAWTKTSLIAIGVTAAGIPVYFMWQWFIKRKGCGVG